MKKLVLLNFVFLIFTISCSSSPNSHITPPYGDLLSNFPQEIKPRSAAVKIDRNSTMAEIFLSLGFYEDTYESFKAWYQKNPEGMKLFVLEKNKASLTKSPHGSVIIEKITDQPKIKLLVNLENESGRWIYLITLSSKKNVWIIEDITNF